MLRYRQAVLKSYFCYFISWWPLVSYLTFLWVCLCLWNGKRRRNLWDVTAKWEWMSCAGWVHGRKWGLVNGDDWRRQGAGHCGGWGSVSVLLLISKSPPASCQHLFCKSHSLLLSFASVAQPLPSIPTPLSTIHSRLLLSWACLCSHSLPDWASSHLLRGSPSLSKPVPVTPSLARYFPRLLEYSWATWLSSVHSEDAIPGACPQTALLLLVLQMFSQLLLSTLLPWLAWAVIYCYLIWAVQLILTLKCLAESISTYWLEYLGKHYLKIDLIGKTSIFGPTRDLHFKFGQWMHGSSGLCIGVWISSSLWSLATKETLEGGAAPMLGAAGSDPARPVFTGAAIHPQSGWLGAWRSI